MVTAILSTRNHRFHHETLMHHRNPNSHLNHHKTTAPRRRKRTLVVSPATNTTNLVMEKVKILKRGVTLSEFLIKEENDVDLVLNRLGPEPEIVQNQIRGLILVGDYAGAGYSVSPSPSSVPFPCFLDKN
ncbi:hypothetical protein AALP_AA6G025000 [Arabis alpina]|uniref:Uncharacterized protein n=1 Tax=Arabis alpina TaxID=50452 RepID=A0A087GLM7_ARAAL|nr:hypothetical protein AALP_AA6G025000 [Arabis alpina]